MVRIILSKFGDIDADKAEFIVKCMEECYERLQPHGVELVDLYLFERSSSAASFMSLESKRVGVATSRFDELFFAFHDAWRGTPRITICLDRIGHLSEPAKLGSIRHEVGHSVLHGEPRYYMFSLPPAFRRAMKDFALSPKYTMDLLYLASIAVKDYEVTRLLQLRGYLEDQVAYATLLLEVTDAELLSWKIAEKSPLARILHLFTCLKSTCCAAPLTSDEKHGADVKRKISNSVSYLGEKQSGRIMKVISQASSSLEVDTFENLNRVAELALQHIIAPTLRDQGPRKT